MSISAIQVYDYLDTHPVSCHEGDFESILEMLHRTYTESNPISNEKIRQGFQQVSHLLERLTNEESDTVFYTVCDICLEYEQLAFSHSLTVGMHLMTEINGLP